MLILSIAQFYYENRSKNKLKNLLLFYKFFGMNTGGPDVVCVTEWIY